MALTRQCALAGIARSTVYAPHLVAAPDDYELLLLTLVDAEYRVHLTGMGQRCSAEFGVIYQRVENKVLLRLQHCVCSLRVSRLRSCCRNNLYHAHLGPTVPQSAEQLQFWGIHLTGLTTTCSI